MNRGAADSLRPVDIDVMQSRPPYASAAQILLSHAQRACVQDPVTAVELPEGDGTQS